MRAITVKSVEVLEEELQLNVHHSFGMEQHSDYVFKPGGGKIYSATIVMEMSDHVISQVKEATSLFPDQEFILDDLDMDSNIATTYRLKGGEILEKKFNIS
ncbi:MAG: hypothetical protein K8R52_05850 [Bacteroidales bacterium]|nr:hypothetical protein [Bacteroidales bacterium]